MRQSYYDPIEPKPEQKLADLMARELQVHPNAIALRLFIRCHWSKISMLAHQIHDDGATDQPTTNSAPALDYATRARNAGDMT